MSLSRWKMMAGVLGVSIGGLAAAASQCPKLDKSKGRSPEGPVAVAEAPKVPPAGAPSAPPTLALPAVPAPSSLPPIPDSVPTPAAPAAPMLSPAGTTPPPSVAAPVAPVSLIPPNLPTTPPAPEVKPTKLTGATPAAGGTKLVEVPPMGSLPPIPPAQITPASGASPKPSEPAKPLPPSDLGPKPTVVPPSPPASVDLIPPLPGKPPVSLPVVGASGVAQPTGPEGGFQAPLNTDPIIPIPTGRAASPPSVGSPTVPPPPAPDIRPDKPSGPPTQPIPLAEQLPAADSKFRILLRVGEGEPTFEVKSGDNLVLKVACEKVDIKSPEKGHGMSEVVARGKVRFAGFGAEGTCDELKFFAGTGEVSMTGEVKVVVRDKLGRVESELTTATLKYKIDASATAGTLKP